MESEIQNRIEKTVTEILQSANMDEMTEYKVRKIAAEKLKLDLSLPKYKLFIRQIVDSFLQNQQAKQSEEVEQEEEEEEDDERTKRASGEEEYDDEGNLIVCRLSDKRKVTIQDFRGKTLVSIREYYKKDGKELPSSKGISLTAEQWDAFKKNVPAIEKAIGKMESRLM
ncbi:DEK, C-terminal [Dillenia turbinata]|uniref:DEK, C-terminal n=1 Tax=Dillenia turbinata TaxID=194707 RepID=A0AAN8VT41_9MAGN